MSNRVLNTVAVVSFAVAFVLSLLAPALTDSTESAETQQRAFTGQIRALYITYTPYDTTGVVEYKANREAAGEILANVGDIFETIDSVELPKTEMVLTSLGNYYITGYTSIECGGSTMTASGAEVYYAPDSERMTTPTTCAADVWGGYHEFGDLLYVPAFDRLYVVKDTGSAVLKKHIDLYFPDEMYNYALSITGYYEVFAVEYVDTTYKPADYDIRETVVLKVLGWKIKTN